MIAYSIMLVCADAALGALLIYIALMIKQRNSSNAWFGIFSFSVILFSVVGTIINFTPPV